MPRRGQTRDFSIRGEGRITERLQAYPTTASVVGFYSYGIARRNVGKEPIQLS